MNIITLDFETYYASDYGLRKFTTENYIRHSSFEVIGVSIKLNNEDAVWFSGTKEQTKRFLNGYKWDCIVVAHNAMFDMAILNWHFDIRPKHIVDTLSMARALYGTEVGGSLGALVAHFELGVKGKEVLNALNKHRIDFTAEELSRYGEYCRNDSELTYKLFGVLAFNFPISELRLIDMTIRMFTEPTLSLDVGKLTDHLEKVQIMKAKLMERIKETKADLMSNPKFAELLKLLGVEPPMKISPANGKDTYAFAKSDEEFKALLEHENTYVQALVSARLGVKSTLEETRTERFIGIANRGIMPVPLRYYAAHTGRWGGDDKLNLQNLPRKSPLKHAICAPKGFVIMDSDSSQIEARTLAWLAGQDDLVKAFEKGEDVYSIMASTIYNKPIAEIAEGERFVGKMTILGCISEGTLVLCNSGWKPIEQVSINDKLWDGEEWVCHQGLLNKGWKETLNLSGVWLTPDHKVLCGTQWLEAQSVVADESILCQALATGAENLPLLAISQGHAREYERLLLSVDVVPPSTLFATRTSGCSKALDAIHVQKSLAQILANYTGVTAKYSQMTSIVRGYLTGFQAVLADAIQSLPKHLLTMVGGVYLYTPRGGRIEGHFCNTLSPLQVGKTQSTTLTALIITKVTNLITCGLQLNQKTQKTNEKLKSCRRNLMTYDLAYAGPRNRYTIATTAGSILVHNCGYGMGATKFRKQLKVFGVDVTEEQATSIIHIYRETYPRIPALWRQASKALEAIQSDQSAPLGLEGVLAVEGTIGIRLPNGLYLKYPNLRKRTNDNGKAELVYDTKKGKSVMPNHIYGGKCVENVTQALARIIIGEQMLALSKRYRVVMTVHDAIACLVPVEEVEEGKVFVESCMKNSPLWAYGLPLNCETGSGLTYGDC